MPILSEGGGLSQSREDVPTAGVRRLLYELARRRCAVLSASNKRDLGLFPLSTADATDQSNIGRIVIASNRACRFP